MRSLTVRCIALLTLVLTPVIASAQTSTISGTVKDASGGVLPGVTVEVSSPALIEKTRSTVTSGSGTYSILALRPGIYTVKFELPGFATVIREGIELTSDFTATINADLKVGTLEETLTVTGESPIVDTSNITQRVVMTQEVRDALPTGRNIQAVGIMIPGTTLALGGGGALSRDVGGSGNLQQSPLQYRGSGDTVQTIEGMRLNNLCAQGAYSGVYWNDASFEEFSYVTGADSAEMGQGGMRVNMVPRDGGNSFRGSAIFNYAGESFGSDNCGSPGIGLPCTRSNLSGSKTFNAEQHAHQRRRDPEDLGRQSVDRRPDPQEQGLVQLHVQALGLDQDQGRRLLRQEPLAVRLRPRLHAARPRRWPHRQQRRRASRGRCRARTRSRSTTTSSASTAITGASRRRFRPRPPACR